MSTPRLPRDDLSAAMAARRELGPDYDDAFVESVVERLRESLDLQRPAPPKVHRRTGDYPLTLAILSMLAGIPLSAIGVVNAGLPGLIVVWAGLVLINAIYTQRPRS